MKPRLHSKRSQISSHVWPSANSKTSRARRASSARPVRLLACLVSSLLSVFVRLMAFGMTAIVVYKWLLQSARTYLKTPRVRDGVHLGAVLDGDRRRVLD